MTPQFEEDKDLADQQELKQSYAAYQKKFSEANVKPKYT